MLIARLVFYALCLTVLVLAASAGSGCSGEYNLDDPPEFTATIEAAGDDDGDDDTSDDGGLAGPQTDDSFHVTVFDVGLGDASLLTVPDGDGAVRMLIDGGAPAEGVETICPYLDRHRIERIDVMVMTHPDYDHSGGLAEIFDCAEVDAVWVNGDASDTDEGYLAFIAALGEWGGEPFVPELGYFTAFGDATVTVIHTLSEAFDDLNNNSMAMRLDYGDFSMVFGADLHAESQQRVADEAPGTLACGVVRVPSHAGYPFSQDFVDALGAEYALVSVDSTVIPDEYPDQRTLDAYADAGMTVLLTEDTGHMTVRLGGAGEIIVEMPL